MRGIALFAVLPCFCMAGYGQSAQAPSGTVSASRATIPQPQFKFDGRWFGLVPASGGSATTISCGGLGSDRNQTTAEGAAGQLSRLPCLDATKLAEMAQMNAPAFPAMNRQLPNGEFAPIPTQWPDAKVEQIPTTWANLKLQPIQEQSHSGPARR